MHAVIRDHSKIITGGGVDDFRGGGGTAIGKNSEGGEHPYRKLKGAFGFGQNSEKNYVFNIVTCPLHYCMLEFSNWPSSGGWWGNTQI